MQFMGFKSDIRATKITKDHQLTNTGEINCFTTKFTEHDTLIQYFNYKDLIITLLQLKSVPNFIDNNGDINIKIIYSIQDYVTSKKCYYLHEYVTLNADYKHCTKPSFRFYQNVSEILESIKTLWNTDEHKTILIATSHHFYFVIFLTKSDRKEYGN